MNTKLTGLLCAALTISLVSVAFAYDWRQKITYGNDPTKRAATRFSATYATPVLGADVESRRAFSYQPLAYQPGDTLEVTAKQAELKIGDRVLATVRQGQRIHVAAVQGPWVGTHIEHEGRQISGWILASELGPATPLPKACP